MTRIFKYVLISEIAEYEAKGWVFSAYLGSPHGFYAVLMEFIWSEDETDI